ncbi:34045_t:CDS:1, partial [Gigaspora margarita]
AMLKLKIIERLQNNREIPTKNEAMLPKESKTETLQEHAKSVLTNELALKEYDL